jgi:hypothetical protein
MARLPPRDALRLAILLPISDRGPVDFSQFNARAVIVPTANKETNRANGRAVVFIRLSRSALKLMSC